MESAACANDQPIDRVVSYEEACYLLGKSLSSLHRDIRAGRIKRIRLSARKVGIRQSEISRYIDEAEAPE